MRYAVMIEKRARQYRAYAPDVPGCSATGVTWDEVLEHLRDALVVHLASLWDEGLPIPPSTSREAQVYVEVPSPEESPSPPMAQRRRDVPLPDPYHWIAWLGERDAQALLLCLMQAIERDTPLQGLKEMVAGWRANAHRALTADDYRASVDYYLEVSVDARLHVLARPELLHRDDDEAEGR